MNYHAFPSHTYIWKWTIKSHNRNECMQIGLFKLVSAILQMAVYDPMKLLALVALFTLYACAMNTDHWMHGSRYPWNEKDNVISIGNCGIFFQIQSHNWRALHLRCVTNITGLFWICVYKRRKSAYKKDHRLYLRSH
jgi:hypothetical protein